MIRLDELFEIFFLQFLHEVRLAVEIRSIQIERIDVSTLLSVIVVGHCSETKMNG